MRDTSSYTPGQDSPAFSLTKAGNRTRSQLNLDASDRIALYSHITAAVSPSDFDGYALGWRMRTVHVIRGHPTLRWVNVYMQAALTTVRTRAKNATYPLDDLRFAFLRGAASGSITAGLTQTILDGRYSGFLLHRISPPPRRTSAGCRRDARDGVPSGLNYSMLDRAAGRGLPSTPRADRATRKDDPEWRNSSLTQQGLATSPHFHKRVGAALLSRSHGPSLTKRTTSPVIRRGHTYARAVPGLRRAKSAIDRALACRASESYAVRNVVRLFRRRAYRDGGRGRRYRSAADGGLGRSGGRSSGTAARRGGR